MKSLLVFLILVFPVITASAQNEHTAMLKNHFLIENQLMITNTRFDFFPVLNNELSIGYGVNRFAELGIFHDFFAEPEIVQIMHESHSRNLVGIRANLSLFSLANVIGIKFLPKRFELCVSGYYGVYHHRHSKYSIYTHYDKKDNADWAHYYKVGARYFICRSLYVTASAGLYNTDRFYLGIGFKL